MKRIILTTSSEVCNLNPFQVVLPYYEKYSSDIDRMMAEAASSAEVMIKSAVDKVEDAKTE